MGVYTELIFQGEVKFDIPKQIQELFDYFFGDSEELYLYIDKRDKLPDHCFFDCPRWRHIGHMSSYYFTPFPLRYMQGKKFVFLRCDLKNYDNEIELFLDWIRPYMVDFYGWHWYEEDEQPTFFVERGTSD